MRQVCSPRIAICFFVSFAVALVSSPSAFPQKSPSDTSAAAHMRSLNNSLLQLHRQLQQADAITARTLRGQAATVITQRSTALYDLIQNDPRAALSFAFSPEVLAELS